MRSGDLARLIAVAGYRAYANSLVGDPPPALREYWERSRRPRVGDLVVETTTIHHRTWGAQAVGELVAEYLWPVQTRAEHEKGKREGDYWKHPEEDYDAVPRELIRVVERIDRVFDHRDEGGPPLTNWTNASFIAVPWDLGVDGGWPTREEAGLA